MTFHWFNPFTWFSPKESQAVHNPIKQSAMRPQTRDWTEQFSINSELTQGLYHNSYQGFKLAGSLAYPPIAIPLWLMGLPVPQSDDEKNQLNFIKIIEDHANDCQMIHLLCHRDATCWIWSYFSSKLGRDMWEFIPDDTISDIIRDIETGEVLVIITDEKITISTAYNVQQSVRRKRTFTRQAVKIEWTENAAAVPGLISGIFKNVIGELPISFANNRDGDEVRGHSDYERILSDLKNYHDTDLAVSELLVKFSPKMIQEVQSVEDWKAANGITDLNDINIASRDFIINLFDKERTTFAWPQGSHDAGMQKLSQIFWKLVQGSGIPELLWGTKVEGNMASADNQLDSVIQFVEDKQRQKNEPYKKLIMATARLRGLSRMSSDQSIISKIKWNALDLVSESVKSTIFQNFANGMSALINSAGITKTMAWETWKKMYPEITDQKYDTFKEGLGEMAKHKAFAAAPYEIIADMTGENDIIEPVEPTPPVATIPVEVPAE